MADTQVQMCNDDKTLATRIKGFGCSAHGSSVASLFAAAAPEVSIIVSQSPEAHFVGLNQLL